MTRYVVPVLGVLLVVIGAVWTLQGANLLGGSFMSGSRLWLVIGLVALVSMGPVQGFRRGGRLAVQRGGRAGPACSRRDPFAGDAGVEALDEHRCGVTAGSWSWPGLAASLARFDADIEVVGPPELRAAFAGLAAWAAQAAGGRGAW